MSEFLVKIAKPEGLDGAEIRAWSELRVSNPALYSPYFQIDYTKLLSRLCDDVHVLVVSREDKPLAFLPFQANISGNRIGFTRPVGSPMTDYHGFICAPDTDFDVHAVLKKAGFGAFHFSSLVGESDGIARYASQSENCAVIDIGSGAEAWRAGQDSSYRRHLKSNRRRIRKSEEEIGTRSFVFNSHDQDVFDTLMKWKREKFFETGKYDVLSADWTQNLLKSLWDAEEGEGLRCVMHAMYFGGRLAAVDLGLTDGRTFHSWIVAYDGELQQLAPGIQLLEALIDESENLGYTRIDLGAGLHGYKRHYASENIRVNSGFIAANGPAAALSQIYGAAESFGERKLGGFGRLPGKARRRFGQIRACEPTTAGRAKAMLDAVRTSGKGG